MKIKKDFIGMFDVLKGHIMFLIVISHVILEISGTLGENSTSLLSHAVEFCRYNIVPMCVFFLLIGYGFRPEARLKKHFSEMAERYLLPYGITSVFIVAISVVCGIIRGNFGIGTVTSSILGCLWGNVDTFRLFHSVWVNGINTIWFITAMFVSECLYNLSFKIKKERLRQAVIFGISVLACFIPNNDLLYKNYGFRLMWSLKAALVVLGVLEVGHVLKQTKFLYNKAKLRIIIPAGVLTAAATIIMHYVSDANLARGRLKFGAIDMLVATAAAVLIIYLYVRLKLPLLKITIPAEFVGRYSFWVMCIHGVEMVVHDIFSYEINVIIDGLFAGGVPVWGLVTGLYIIRLLTIAVPFAAVYFVNRFRVSQKLKEMRKNG